MGGDQIDVDSLVNRKDDVKRVDLVDKGVIVNEVIEDESDNEVDVEQEKRCKCDDNARITCEHPLFDCVYCPCNNFDQIKQNIQCPSCFIWYCCECVGLKGLQEADIYRMLNWECYSCWAITSPIAVHTSSRDTTNESGFISKEGLKEELAKILPAIVKTVIEEKHVTESKKWSDLLKDNQKETQKTIRKVISTGIENEKEKEVVLVRKVVDEASQKADNINYERSRRSCNGIIFGIPESRSDDGEQRRIDDMGFLTLKLGVEAAHIKNVFRAGKRGDGNKKRPMIIRFVNTAVAERWHNGGMGYRTGYICQGNQVYINKDLCLADREAHKRARTVKSIRDGEIVEETNNTVIEEMPPLEEPEIISEDVGAEESDDETDFELAHENVSDATAVVRHVRVVGRDRAELPGYLEKRKEYNDAKRRNSSGF